MGDETRGSFLYRTGVYFTYRNLAAWYDQYRNGQRSKSQIEREELQDQTSNGKAIAALWKQHLGFNTAQISRQSEKVAELEEQITSLKLDRRLLKDFIKNRGLWEEWLGEGNNRAVQPIP